MGKVSLFFRTVRHLKAKQVLYQVAYRLFKIKPLSAYKVNYNKEQLNLLKFSDFLPDATYAYTNGTFKFLNQEVTFKDNIDWGYMHNGKLWNYNLHYGNYLLQENIPLTLRQSWLVDLHKTLNTSSKGLEPYPVSLRIINTIRLISRHSICENHINDALAAEIKFLSGRVEYHLLGNHVLENGFALLMGGAYFQNISWIEQGHSILVDELEEQVLLDGGHFELSPMYHQIILYRLLELIDWYSNWSDSNRAHLSFYKSTASRMLSWLTNITFSNGDIPHFNDSTNGIAYSSDQLLAYASCLKIETDKELLLNQSGYRKHKNDVYEIIVDVAPISASYQAGHGHADALSFILYYKSNPVLVEAGTTTYDSGKVRNYERSSEAHNTVVLNETNQSDVWGSFRVGARAKSTIRSESADKLETEHDGFLKKYGVKHRRTFCFNNSGLTILDKLEGAEVREAVAFFHLHPDMKFIKSADKIELVGCGIMQFNGSLHVEESLYNFSLGFNQSLPATVLKVYFKKELETQIGFI